VPEQNRLGSMHAHCELPSVVSPRIGAAQEVVHASLGYEVRTVEADLKPLNFGLHTACRRAADRSAWRSVVETAMLFDDTRATP